VKFKIEIVGTEPLLMHNARLSNPIDPFTKRLAEITGKRKKTEEDHEDIANRDWDGGLYWNNDPNIGPEGVYVPGQNIERALLDGAKLNKLGQQVKRGLFIGAHIVPLAYSGPRDLGALRADANFRRTDSVKIGMSRTMRTRPMFREWALTAEGYLDEEQMDLTVLRQVAVRAGRLIGLGDWRPRFGRFTATVEQVGDDE
jgi:hypothetical protein